MDSCVDVVDRRWFKIVVIVLGIAIAVMAGFSISAFWTARQGQPINPRTANGLWIANIVLLILAVGIVLWGLITIFFHRSLRSAPMTPDQVVDVTQDTQLRNYLTETEGIGLTTGQPSAITPQTFTVAHELTSTGGGANLVTARGLQRIQAATGY